MCIIKFFNFDLIIIVDVNNILKYSKHLIKSSMFHTCKIRPFGPDSNQKPLRAFNLNSI